MVAKTKKKVKISKIGPKSTKKPSATASLDGKKFPIVAIGASAGGLEAFHLLFSNIPSDTGMAFVIIQHLAPLHPSFLSEILAKITKMPVKEVRNGVKVAPNTVYVIPPNTSMGISQGRLQLVPRSKSEIPHHPINYFMRSLAIDQTNEAIGVILSGTGSDGAEGLKQLKSEGGISFAQSPESARFDGMPNKAITLDHVDFVLSPQDIAKELARIAEHPYLKKSLSYPVTELSTPSDQSELEKIFALIRQLTRVDFTYYKRKTITRRIMRRMALHKIESLDRYCKFLKENISEQMSLHNDLLINVTSFFRDPEFFEQIKTLVFPELFKQKLAQLPLRIWIAGCSTGEECYSLAIILSEYLKDKVDQEKVQIFATDLSESCINFARVGKYSDNIKTYVSQARLKKYFIKLDDGYQVSKDIRNLCIFAKHNLIMDPPYSHLDIISCRNVLIYLQSVLQKKVLSTFHYSLRPHGFLLLGSSESPSAVAGRFSAIEKKEKIFVVKKRPTQLVRPDIVATSLPSLQHRTPREVSDFQEFNEIEKEADHLIASRYAPPSVVITDTLEVIQFRGDTSPYLINPSGRASFNILKMARNGLSSDLKTSIHLAKKNGITIILENLKIRSETQFLTFNIEVVPIRAHKDSHFYLIFFKKIITTPRKKEKKSQTKNRGKSLITQDIDQVAELTQELNSTRSYLESMNRELESINQDLHSANEEILSSNEEMQSTNEELETAKEELQSSNEELTTLNDELQNRNHELYGLNNDLTNFLGSVEIPILIIGSDGTIRRLTPAAQKALNLLPSDIGRAIRHFKSNFELLNLGLDLEQKVKEVTESMTVMESEIQDGHGRWFRLQIRPYKTIDHRIDGAVIVLVDIDSLKRSMQAIDQARTEADNARMAAEAGNQAKDLFLATLSHELRTPLTPILLWSQMLLTEKLDEIKFKKGIETIIENSKIQAKLIDDLLDVSRIIMGKIPMTFIEINPLDVAHQAIELVQSTAESESIKIESDFHPQIGTMMADPKRLLQVLGNLLTNAIKFSPLGSKIVMSLKKAKSKEDGRAIAVFQVIDSGKGISHEFLPHIFNHFSQEDISSTRSTGGLGLGLAIVKNLVQLHGGTVQAESPGENMGATFTVCLPIISETRSSIPSSAINLSHPEPKTLKAKTKSSTGPSGIRVLLVEDELSTREAISEALGSLGIIVKAVESTQEAIYTFPSFGPDVLVSDLAMPKEDGYSLIKKIRSLSSNQGGQVPAIALTAYAGLDDAKRVLASGFQVHLTKPFELNQLVDAIMKVSTHHT